MVLERLRRGGAEARAERTEVDFSGVWRSRAGAEVFLSVDPFGNVTGTYQPVRGGRNHQYPLKGFVAGDLISFMVSLPEQRAIACWSGQLAAGIDGEELRAMRHTAQPASDPTDPECDHPRILTGNDDFARVSDLVGGPPGRDEPIDEQ